MSAAASIPCPVTSPSTIASRFVGGLQVVVDVAADADERGRLVDRTDLEPRHVRAEPRQQRPLHRVGERLLLLVEPRVVDRERGLGGDEQRGVEGLVRQRPARVERDERQRREELGGRGDRDDGRGRAALQERHEQPVRVPELRRRRRVEAYRMSLHQAAARRRRDHVLGLLEDRRASPRSSCGPATWTRWVSTSPRSSGTRITATSTSSSSTTVVAIASRVSSSERLCANEREIS